MIRTAAMAPSANVQRRGSEWTIDASETLFGMQMFYVFVVSGDFQSRINVLMNRSGRAETDGPDVIRQPYWTRTTLTYRGAC